MTDRVMAIFSYSTSNPEELSFKEGDSITVIGPSDDSTLWWLGMLNGRVGLFPYNYIVRIQQPLQIKTLKRPRILFQTNPTATLRTGSKRRVLKLFGPYTISPAKIPKY